MSFDIHCTHLLPVAYQPLLQFPQAGIEADTKMCLSWWKLLYAKVIMWVEKISANCCENLVWFLILVWYITEKGGLRTHFSSFVCMNRPLATCREASGGYYGWVIPQWPDLAAILWFMLQFLFFPQEHVLPEGQHSRAHSHVTGFTTAMEGTLHQMDRAHSSVFCFVSQVIPSTSWSWTLNWNLNTVRFQILYCQLYKAGAVTLFGVCILAACGFGPWESQAEPHLK